MHMTAGQELQSEANRVAVINALRSGMTIREAARATGLSKSYVHDIKRRQMATLAEERQEAGARVFKAIDAELMADLEEVEGVMGRAREADDDEMLLKAVAVRERLLGRLAKLWGVDDAAPLRRAGLTSALSVVRSAPASLRDEWMGLLRSGDPAKIARVEREAREYMARMDAPPMAVIDVEGG